MIDECELQSKNLKPGTQNTKPETRMEYNFKSIEEKWQRYWEEKNVYKVNNDFSKPKYYVLDMFPYPSGAGLHVGHPLGYIASDIFARYKRLKGYNVLHPMGFDAFGLPAEQYAIETGQHPAVTTKNNIATFKKQFNKIGFSFDWSREVKTSDPDYYKWTQWIFLQLYKSWYNRKKNKAEYIDELIKIFEKEGNKNHPVPDAKFEIRNPDFAMLKGNFSPDQWKAFSEKTKHDILMEYRLAYCGVGEVNWCEALGTVLANDEVVNGVSERGGYPVVKKKLRQWYLRITEYADRLLEGLQQVEFSEAMKEMQTNWIGKSMGAEIVFPLSISPRLAIGERENNENGEENERGKNMENIDEAKKKNVSRNEEIDKEKEKQKENTEKEKMPGFGYAEYKVGNAMSFENAKQMRKKSTQAEEILWQHLSNKQIGYKFRKQHPIENYIADFICLDVWLIIEIDGGYHANEEQKEADETRDESLKEIGFTTLRFTNEEVLNNLEKVIQTIKQTCDEIKINSAQKINKANILPVKETDDNIKDITAEKITEAGGSSPLQGEAGVRVFTTRPDTIFGVDFMVLAPEHELVEKITTAEQKKIVEDYIAYVNSRSERERMAEKKISGCFTGAYTLNPFNGREIPIWISEYVLAGYGTGAIMAVPCGDERDHKFATHFNIPITNIIGEYYNGKEANATKDALLQNSDFLNGIVMRDASEIVINKLEKMGIGQRKINYKMRDAAFSRQRYWGEPFPIIWKNNIAYPLDESKLPLELPYVENYKPGPNGAGPLENITSWINQYADSSKASPAGRLEGNTMPGYAGSSWYFLRYMDPHNDQIFCDRKASDYWNQVDLYIGGTEHAVGHLLYSRMWTKALCDLGYIGFDEPYKKLVNQGMITGISEKMWRIYNYSKFGPFVQDTPDKTFSTLKIFNGENVIEIKLPEETNNIYVSNAAKSLFRGKETIASFSRSINADIKFVKDSVLDIDKYIANGLIENKNSVFVCPGGFYQNNLFYPFEFSLNTSKKFFTFKENEKMSKSLKNVVNPDDVIDNYGADTFRMYEMFLGPVEQSKPWDTKGIEGVHRFLKKLWRLFFDEQKGCIVKDEKPAEKELKILHKTIKKIEEDTERFSFNTAVSQFMICVNELADLKCHKKEILEPLLILITPYAPHIAEELWHQLGNNTTILDASFPTYNEQLTKNNVVNYPVAVNGKTRTELAFATDAENAAIEKEVLQNDIIQKWLEGKCPKKIIIVKGRMVNVVV